MINISKDINIYQTLEKAIIILFYISIFLLPANLFLVWRTPEAYIQGHFIDYLAPKLYLQQVVLWLLLLVWGAKHRVATRGKQPESLNFGQRLKLLPVGLLLVGFAGGVALFRSLFSEDWGLTSLLVNFLSGPLFFSVFLWKERGFCKKHLFSALRRALLFQALVALWQWYTQTSVGGYWFLGEPDLRLPEIATTSLPGALRKLPYGTTPHPNILAGWMVLGLGWIVAEVRNIRSLSRGKTVELLLSGALLLWTLLLTESWSAWGSLLAILIFVWCWPRAGSSVKAFFSRKPARISLFVAFFLIQIMGVFLPQILGKMIPNSLPVAETSLTRRSDLQSRSLTLLADQPLGTGFRQMFQGIFDSETMYWGGRFLQPVHNTGFLMLLSLGLWILFVIFIYICIEHNKYSLFYLVFLTSLPFFTLDHYLFSTLSGQFIGILFIHFLHKDNF